MLKFIAGMILGGILAMYPALAYPQQIHHLLDEVGLGTLLPPVDAPSTVPVTETPETPAPEQPHP